MFLYVAYPMSHIPYAVPLVLPTPLSLPWAGIFVPLAPSGFGTAKPSLATTSWVESSEREVCKASVLMGKWHQSILPLCVLLP